MYSLFVKFCSFHLQDSADTSQQLAGLEVVVEQPFTLDCQFSAPPRVQSIMPAQPEPSQFLAPAGVLGGNPKAAVTLPLGPPAVMLACITAMAPCQVILCSVRLPGFNKLATLCVDMLPRCCLYVQTAS